MFLELYEKVSKKEDPISIVIGGDIPSLLVCAIHGVISPQKILTQTLNAEITHRLKN